MKSWSTKQHSTSPNHTGSHTHMLINVLIYKCTHPCTLPACLVSINSVISSHHPRYTHAYSTHTNTCAHTHTLPTRTHKDATTCVCLHIFCYTKTPWSWFKVNPKCSQLPVVYDQKLLVICLVRRSVYIMHVYVCLSLVSASWPPSLWQLVWLHDGWYWL